jgi:hypothetical protein
MVEKMSHRAIRARREAVLMGEKAKRGPMGRVF